MKQLLSTLLVLTLFISCSKDTKTVTDYTAKNEQEIIPNLMDLKTYENRHK